MQDPELTIDRALMEYLQLGYSSVAVNPKTFEDSKEVAKQGGKVAKVARQELEAKTGKDVVTSLNAKQFLSGKNKSTELNTKENKE
ncbi:MAG: antirepressor [Ignavibacteria bacterium]|nr:antirepressor [Ignavibacteria bacterium]